MLNIFTVAFFGHRYIKNLLHVEKLLENQIKKLVCEKEYIEFLVGRNGEFDQCVSSSVLRIRRKIRHDNSALILVLPYSNSEYLNNKDNFNNYYTDIEFSQKALKTHPKAAIQMRNCDMVDRADLIIFYVEHKSGGAWQTMQYALRKGKMVLNLAEENA